MLVRKYRIQISSRSLWSKGILVAIAPGKKHVAELWIVKLPYNSYYKTPKTQDNVANIKKKRRSIFPAWDTEID